MKTRSKEARNSDEMISIQVVNPHAAGIDIGSKSHFVCVAQDNVKEFPVFTSDLHEIAKHLQMHQVKTVALESTGFYWKPLFVMLQDEQDAGIDEYSITSSNARHIRYFGSKKDYKPSKKLQIQKNDPKFDVASYVYKMANGVDLTQIPGTTI
jgi:hypothetical protein